MPTQSEAIQTYLRAKDENRPYLMKRAFSEAATLEMVVNSGTISFPSFSNGVDAITQVLVRDFGKAFENVCTFCLAHAPEGNDTRFSCNWLVGLSEKATGAVRVGCGRYDWFFEVREPFLVERLKITIDIMETLSPDTLHPVMDWLSKLPYPWCSAAEVINGIPNLVGLKPIFNYIDQRHT